MRMAEFGLQAVVEAFRFFLPAYVANTAAGVFGGGVPLDFGRRLWDGRRLFGDGKTLKGTGTGVLCGVLYKVVENLYLSRTILAGAGLAFLLAVGAIAGDIAASFIKRRLDIESGESAPLLDQLDFVVGGLLLAGLAVKISMETVIILLLITPVGHLGVNIIGFLLHKKEVPW